ncbi:MAG: hypothetical protein PHQ12_05140 [Chthoniobacteraceae bacterium]|nr:hypothetical protein [Chthoniobacteraceae bacterium]
MVLGSNPSGPTFQKRAKLRHGLPHAKTLGGGRFSPGSHAARKRRVAQECFQRARERFGVALSHEQPGFAVGDHFGDSRKPGGDDGKPRRHGFGDDGGQGVFAAVGLGGAGEDEEGGFAQVPPDFFLRLRAGETDALPHPALGNAGPEGFFQRAAADDGAFKVEPPPAQEGAGVDQVRVTFFFDATPDGEEPRTAARGPRLGDAREIDAVVDGVDLHRVLRAAPPQPVAAEVGLGNDKFGFAHEVVEGDGEVRVAEHVVGVPGEAVGDAVELFEPVGGAGGDAGEVGVNVPDAVFAQARAQPGCRLRPAFVGALAPAPQGEEGFPRVAPQHAPGFHFGGERFGGGEVADGAGEFLGAVGGNILGDADGVDGNLGALAAHFEDFPVAEGLGEGGEPFEEVGEGAHGSSRLR